MTLSPQELDIARKVQEQWWTREDFAEILQEFRKRQWGRTQEIAPQKIPESMQQEQQRAQQIMQEQPWISPEMARSKASQEQAEQEQLRLKQEKEAEPSFLEKRWQALKESASPDALLWFWAKRTVEWIKEAGEGIIEGDFSKLATWPLKAWEWFVQSAAWVIAEWFNQILATWGEFVAKPILESLDADTLAKLNKVPSTAVEGVKQIAKTDTLQKAIEVFESLPENVQKDIESAFVLIWTKTWKSIKDIFSKNIAKSPLTKVWRQQALSSAERVVTGNVKALTWTSMKATKKDLLDFGNFIKENRSQYNLIDKFDDAATTTYNIWQKQINVLNKWLENIKWTYKPKGAREVLEEMKNNIDKINFKSAEKARINELIKKIENEWLTLSELNEIKRSINSYTKWWTKSWLEGAWLKADSVRDKYREVMQFIENTAKREVPWLDVAKLNRDWALSSKFWDDLLANSLKAWKEQAIKKATEPGLIKWTFAKIRDITSTPFTKADPTQRGILDLESKMQFFLDEIVKGTDDVVKYTWPWFIEKTTTGGKEILEHFKKKKVDNLPISGITQTTENAKNKFDINKLQKIWKWSDRIVYDLWDGNVLKVAVNPRWIDQNMWALNIKLQDAWIVPKVKEIWKDYVIMKKVPNYNQLWKVEQEKLEKFVTKINDVIVQEKKISELNKILKEYWWEEIAKLDPKTFWWGDLQVKNLSYIWWKPVLIDEWTIALNNIIKKYKRRVVLESIKAWAVLAFVKEADVETLYQIWEYLIWWDVLKNNTIEKNKEIINIYGGPQW